MDPRIVAIRDSDLVGRGSCTSVDECLTDSELIELLDEQSIATTMEAVNWAIRFEDLHLENALNARWGEDDDPQLVTWQAREKAKGEST